MTSSPSGRRPGERGSGRGRTPPAPGRAPRAPTRGPTGAPRAREAAEHAQGIRLHKVLADAGIASRRAAEQLIEQGRVRVDGVVVRTQGVRVDPARAKIEVDGERIHLDPRHEYILLNKPPGVVTTAKDPEGRRTVLDLVRSKSRVYPVGRLDAETTGLLLLTNDGQLAYRLMHPRYEVRRVYVAEVKKQVRRESREQLLQGVRLEDGMARATAVRVLERGRTRTQLEITITEGRKREVRRMLEAVGHPVLKLARVAFGPLRLGPLPVGAARTLSPEEVGRLLEAVGL